MDYIMDKDIIKICKDEYDFFLSKPNVVGIGLGYRVVKGFKTWEKAISVFVTKKVSLNSLSSNELIPNVYKGIQTDVIVSGSFGFCSLTDKTRPVTGGYAIGPAGKSATGTLGGLVTDDKSTYILSTNHAIALNCLPKGTRILQSSAEYGGNAHNDVIAYLSSFIPLKFSSKSTDVLNVVDAAIAVVENKDIVSSAITFAGIPTGTAKPILGMMVKMICSTSMLVTGKLIAMGAIVKFKTNNGCLMFKDQLIFDFSSSPGDSGAFILDENNKVLGLNCATSMNFSMANPIDEVLSKLQVKLVTR